jgi:hypothetical protein
MTNEFGIILAVLYALMAIGTAASCDVKYGRLGTGNPSDMPIPLLSFVAGAVWPISLVLYWFMGDHMIEVEHRTFNKIEEKEKMLSDD